MSALEWWLSDWEPMVIGAAGRYDYSIPAWYSYVVLPAPRWRPLPLPPLKLTNAEHPQQ